MAGLVRTLPQTPEDRKCSPAYDYTICNDDEALQRAIMVIDRWGFTLISVTQSPDGVYRVFYSTEAR